MITSTYILIPTFESDLWILEKLKFSISYLQLSPYCYSSEEAKISVRFLNSDFPQTLDRFPRGLSLFLTSTLPTGLFPRCSISRILRTSPWQNSKTGSIVVLYCSEHDHKYCCSFRIQDIKIQWLYRLFRPKFLLAGCGSNKEQINMVLDGFFRPFLRHSSSKLHQEEGYNNICSHMCNT